jgi:transaldolase / glucose-6-phosphate isomerase
VTFTPPGLTPSPLADAVARRLETWTSDGLVARLWQKDPTLWTDSGEERWLAWLDVLDAQRQAIGDRRALADEVRAEGFTDVLLLGMGGSSLGPEVTARVIGAAAGRPRLHVLDSTDPAQVHRFDAALDLAKTLVVVASKSGTTLEPNAFKQYFFARMQETVGADRAGRHFVAITDPGSQMEQAARADGFRAVVFGEPEIGGRYSVLSAFGTVPAALIGVDLDRFLGEASGMADACRQPDASENPGVALGVVLGEAARAGRDKLTIVASPALAPLGAWLEQLVAESTGKRGTAIIPVDLEAPGPPRVYGDDRMFVYLRFAPEPDADQDAFIDALNRSGQPVVRMDVAEAYGLAQEFFRWEVATAVAGAVLGINPFDQPDVEASKVKTKALTSAFEEEGSLPQEEPLVSDDGLAVYGDEANAKALGDVSSVEAVLRAHLQRVHPGDYFALLAYVDMTDAHAAILQRLRHRVRDARRVATCLGFGPRFLHSTGQAYKGGPASGVFLQITCDDPADLPVPGQQFTFGVIKAAQARGDLGVLTDRGRRALRVHLRDVTAGLDALDQLVARVLVEV